MCFQAITGTWQSFYVLGRTVSFLRSNNGEGLLKTIALHHFKFQSSQRFSDGQRAQSLYNRIFIIYMYTILINFVTRNCGFQVWLTQIQNHT